MSKFIQETELILGIENIFRDANEYIMIVSPFIKLHQRVKDILKAKINNPDVQLIILFGKNEGDISKSIYPDDLLFFSSFPNIEIRYESRLHAKYYANEFSSIITSMNLYDYSQNNNIEVGVQLDASRFSLGNNSDRDAFEYFEQVIDRSELYFKKEPQYSNGFLGFNQKYEQSIITENKLSGFIKGEKVKVNKAEIKKGFCIRCKNEIQLNPQIPLCKSCFESWKKFQNVDYIEKHCHICGKQYQTSYSKPTCYTCFRANKELFNTTSKIN